MKNLFAWLRHAAHHPYAMLPSSPCGIINSARDWVGEWESKTPRDIRRGPSAAYQEIDSPGFDVLPRPNALDDGSPARKALRIFPRRETGVYFLKGARIIDVDGVVISPDNQVFAEFTYVDQAGGIDAHSIFRRRRFPKATPLAGWYATICYPSSRAYYHWMIESLPRLRLIEEFLDALDGVFVPDHMPSSMTQSILALGVREDQIVPMSMGKHYAPEHLLVPAYCSGLDIPHWVPEYFKRKILNGREFVPTRRIYISRAGVTRRRVTNEQEVMAVLKHFCFEEVRPEQLSFREQAELFASAEMVVGSTGAALSNIVFCHPGSSLLSLLPYDGLVPHVFYSLACAVGMKYWDIIGKPVLNSDSILDEHVDFSIDPDRLNQTLIAMLGACDG